MKLAYYESKWKHDDLNGKTIQFALRTCSGMHHGFGRLRIHIHGYLISVCICQHIPGKGTDELVEDVHNLWNPSLADKIEPHPDKAVADFRLIE